MPELREVFEMTTKQIEPDLDAWRDQEGRQRRAARNRKLGAIAVAAMFGLAAVAVIIGAQLGRDETIPADQPTTEQPTTTEPNAVEVATGFAEAFGAFDADRAITYLADGADLSYTDAGTAEGLAPLLAFLQAQGYEQILAPCAEESSSSAFTHVRCPFAFHGIRSDEIGLGPYGGSYFDLRVRDGKITGASWYWETEEFSPQMWEPFATWVSETYPKDFDAMYTGGGTSFRITEGSTQLWKQHTREYAEEMAQGTT